MAAARYTRFRPALAGGAAVIVPATAATDLAALLRLPELLSRSLAVPDIWFVLLTMAVFAVLAVVVRGVERL